MLPSLNKVLFYLIFFFFVALSCGEKSRKPSETRVPQRNAAKHLHIHLDPCQSPAVTWALRHVKLLSKNKRSK